MKIFLRLRTFLKESWPILLFMVLIVTPYVVLFIASRIFPGLQSGPTPIGLPYGCGCW